MDYVLFGMGYGATLMLLGWALRTFGPQLKYSRPAQSEESNFVVEQRFWVRFIQGLGGVFAIVGTAMVLLTFVVVLLNPNDSTGTTISFAIWIFSIVAVLLWCVLYVHNYGLTGIWSRTGGYRNPTAPSLSASTSGVNSVQPKKRIERDPSPVTDTASPQADVNIEQDHPTTDEPDTVDSATEPELDVNENDAVGEEDQSAAAVYDFGDGGDTTVPRDAGSRAEALRRLRERQARARQASQER